MEATVYGIEVYEIPDTNEEIAEMLLRLVKHYGDPAEYNTIFHDYEEALRSRNYDERLNVDSMFFHWIRYFEELLANLLTMLGMKIWTGNNKLCIG